MANAIYPKWKEAIMQASANSSLGGTVKAALTRSGAHTYSASHQYLSDLTSPHATYSDALASKTYTAGVLDAADFKFTAPTADGNQYDQLHLFIDTGNAATSRLVAFYDTGVTALPVTPNGGDINIVIDASGLFAL